MKNDIQKYKDENLIVFSVGIEQKSHKSGAYKKELRFPKDWEKFTLDKTFINEGYNGLALLTGKINDIIVIDIDNIEHWEQFLNEHDKEEPDTVKVISGSGGIHLYFKYTNELNDVKSTSHCFDKKYDIDIRTNGGCIIAPPTKYYNKNFNKDVEYMWVNNIFDF
jgi:hypothetical protein